MREGTSGTGGHVRGEWTRGRLGEREGGVCCGAWLGGWPCASAREDEDERVKRGVIEDKVKDIISARYLESKQHSSSGPSSSHPHRSYR